MFTPLTCSEQSEEDRIINAALTILAKRIKERPTTLSDPTNVKRFLMLAYASEEREVFSILWMDSQNRLIDFEPLAYGTVNQCSVYPREVVKSALQKNAAACIIAHNHPSGAPEPSGADLHLTAHLKTALSMVDVKILDHMIVAPSSGSGFSFAENGVL